MPSRRQLFFALLVLASGSWVLGARWQLIADVANPVPYNDEWYAEAPMFHDMAWNECLRWIFEPHADHHIVHTKALSFALLRANSYWDVRFQMAANAVIAAALFVPLLALLRPFAGPVVLTAAAAGFAWLYASTIFYENTIWGFQSQFYFLVLFSTLHLLLTIGHEAFTRGWWAGVICGLAAIASMGSGAIAPMTVGVVAAQLWWCEPARRRSHAATLLVVFALAVFGMFWLPRSAPPPPFHADVFWHTFWHALAFPGRYYSGWGLLLWLPLLALAVTQVRRRNRSRAELALLATGFWVLLQALAIGYRRPISGAVLPVRYYDILVFGLVANLGAWLCLWEKCRRARFRRFYFGALAALALAWGWVAIQHARETDRIQATQILPKLREWRQEQIRRIKAFVLSHDVAQLRHAGPFELPVSDTAILENLLVRPHFCAYLPFELRLPINLQFPPPAGSPPLENALPITVPNEPGLMHRGTFAKGLGAATLVTARSLPASKSPSSYLLFKVAGDLFAGETEIRLYDHADRLAAVITDLHADKLTPVVVAVPGDRFTVEVVDRSNTAWLAFIEPVEMGRWSVRTLAVLRHAAAVKWAGVAAVGGLFLWTVGAIFLRRRTASR